MDVGGVLEGEGGREVELGGTHLTKHLLGRGRGRGKREERGGGEGREREEKGEILYTTLVMEESVLISEVS